MEIQHVYWLPSFGWFAINIGIPIIGPLFMLWLVGIPPATAPLASNNVIKSIGKGELLWAVMGMAAAACYELVSLQEIKIIKEWSSPIWTAFGLHILLIVVSVFIVGVNSLDLPAGYIFPYPHIRDMRIFTGSVLSMVLVIVTYSATHATLVDQEHKRAAVDRQAIMDRMEHCMLDAQRPNESCLKEIK